MHMVKWQAMLPLTTLLLVRKPDLESIIRFCLDGFTTLMYNSLFSYFMQHEVSIWGRVAAFEWNSLRGKAENHSVWESGATLLLRRLQ